MAYWSSGGHWLGWKEEGESERGRKRRVLYANLLPKRSFFFYFFIFLICVQHFLT